MHNRTEMLPGDEQQPIAVALHLGRMPMVPVNCFRLAGVHRGNGSLALEGDRYVIGEPKQHRDHGEQRHALRGQRLW